MMHLFKTWLPLSLFTLILMCSPSSILAQEEEDQSEFNYIEGDDRGPESWGLIKEEWAICNTGKMQSPIDLVQFVSRFPPNSEKVIWQYNPEMAVLVNRGHDVSLEWKGESSKIEIGGTQYILKQCHWHTTSEHAINGKRYDLELHLVHMSQDGKIAVIGVLYQYGKPDPFLSKLSGALEKLGRTSTKEVDVGSIDPNEARPVGCRFYRYMGSLTTPPCSEGVLWTVYREVATVSPRQVALLQEAVHDNFQENARPLQPSNGTRVNLYSGLVLQTCRL